MAISKSERQRRQRELGRFIGDENQWLAHDLELEHIEFEKWHHRFINHKNGKEIDIWPSTKKFKDRQTNYVGEYQYLEDVIKERIL